MTLIWQNFRRQMWPTD